MEGRVEVKNKKILRYKFFNSLRLLSEFVNSNNLEESSIKLILYIDYKYCLIYFQ